MTVLWKWYRKGVCKTSTIRKGIEQTVEELLPKFLDRMMSNRANNKNGRPNFEKISSLIFQLNLLLTAKTTQNFVRGTRCHHSGALYRHIRFAFAYFAARHCTLYPSSAVRDQVYRRAEISKQRNVFFPRKLDFSCNSVISEATRAVLFVRQTHMYFEHGTLTPSPGAPPPPDVVRATF